MRMKWMVFLGLLIALLLAIAIRADSPGFSIDWYVVSGGGGRSTGGAFVLDDSVLQSGGITSGGNYQLQSGFWYGAGGNGYTPTPTQTPTRTLTPTMTRTATPTQTSTPTRTPQRLYLPAMVKNISYYWCDPYEPNDRLSQARGPLPSGTTLWAKLCVGDNNDYYYIELSELRLIRIDLTNVPAGTDYELGLYDGAGNLVFESRNRENSDEHIEHMPVQTGRYYIRVYPFTGRSDTEQYCLMVRYD